MRKYQVRLITKESEISYHTIDASDFLEFTSKMKSLLQEHPDKSLVDFETYGAKL